jgi:hypothetical protein
MREIDAILELEGGECESAEQAAVNYQVMINGGSGWSMQGSVGRGMMDMIESGKCMLGKVGHRDYYGNYIPARGEVRPGTKGSPEFVSERMGAEWLAMLEQGEGA